MTVLLCAMFFCSGAAALLFETLWFHQAGLAFGNSIWASSLVLAGFMAGLALGNAGVARWGHRLRRPVVFYALLEAAIAFSGIGLVHLLPQLVPILTPLLRPFSEQPLALGALRLGSAFLLLLLPSTAMGATLPLLVAALYRRDRHFGRVLGRLYGWNTLGAVLGAVAGEVLLIRWLGIRGSALAAGLLNAAALGMALLAAPRLDRAPPPPAAAPLGPGAGRLLAAAFVFGGLLMALEVVWFRLALLKVHGSGLAFSIMLAVVLAGIGLGGLVGSAWLSRARAGPLALPAVALGSGLLSIATYVHAVRPGAGKGPLYLWADVLTLALPLMLPVALASGVLFTLLGEALHRECPGEMRAAGLLTLANTSGAMLGPLLGGFVLLPQLGVESSIQLLAALYAATALLLALRFPPASRALRAALGAAGAVFAGLLVFFPRGSLETRYLQDTLRPYLSQDAELVALREGLTETAAYLRHGLFGEPLYHRLVTNSYTMSTTNLMARRYMNLYVYLPAAVHPGLRTALLISYGVGNTAEALVSTRELERIDVVDVSRNVLELSRVVHPDPETHPLRDPRVQLHVEDGRYFLQTTQRRFDLITGEPPPPKSAGIVNLYTREYFELMRSRLSEGGIATYWLPVHALLESDGKAIIAAFCAAFDDCSLWAGAGLDWMLVGTRDAQGPVSATRFRAQWRDPHVGPELRRLGFELPEQLGALFLYGADDLRERTRGVAPLDDDHPERLTNELQGFWRLVSTWRPWLEVRGARRRFVKSEVVGRLWPPEIREATLRWFSWRQRAHDHFLGRRIPFHEKIWRYHETAALDPPLHTHLLWDLGTSPDRITAARTARARGNDDAEVDWALAQGALADRDLASARRHLARARLAGYYPRRAALIEIYALCRDGDSEAARALVEQLGMGGTERGFLDTLAERVDPACVSPGAMVGGAPGPRPAGPPGE